MTEPVVDNDVPAVLPTLAAAQRAQRDAVLTQVVAGRAALVLSPDLAALPAELVAAARAVRRATVADVLGERDGDAEAIVVLASVEARDVAALAAWLVARADDGARVAVSADRATAELLVPLLPGAAVAWERTTSVAWLDVAEADARVDLPGAEAETRGALLLLGADDALSAAPAPALTAPAAGAWAADAAAANVALRRANASMSTPVPSRQSAAAGALQAKAAQVPGLEERLAVEVEVARQNDELFQDARRIIALRDEEIAGLRRALARPSMRAAASATERFGRLPGGSLVLRMLSALLGRRR